MTAAAHPVTRTAEQVFIVDAGGATWALPARRIETVFRVGGITPVPLAPPTIAGLVNLRGRVIVAIDLAVRLLGASAAENDPPRIAVAIGLGDSAVAILVDRAGDVVSIADDAHLVPPAHIAADLARLTSVWFRTSAGLVPLLDIDRLIDFECDRRSGFDRRAIPPSCGATP